MYISELFVLRVLIACDIVVWCFLVMAFRDWLKLKRKYNSKI